MSAATEMVKIDGLWQCSNEEYHSDHSAVSHSMLKDFGENVPRFHRLYNLKTATRGPASDAMKLGTAVHALVLEPERVSLVVAVLPAGHGSSNKVKDTKAMYEAETPQRTIITAVQWDSARRMADAARADDVARELLESPGLVEQSVRVVDPETGIEIKARFDKLFEQGHILDVKTAKELTAEAFGKQAYNLRYHRQTAFYERVRDLAMGEGQGLFWHLVISSDDEPEAAVLQMDESGKALGASQNNSLLAELKTRRETNNWTSRLAGRVVSFSLPPWAYSRGEE